ncbi:MAG: hypothetical protein U5L06_00740 [Rhodovibrio sp.]|nr:hypothetical protein [Rhodovibrio sp.]
MSDATTENLDAVIAQAKQDPAALDDWHLSALRSVRDRIAELEARLDEQEMFEGEALQGHDTQEARAEELQAECERLRAALQEGVRRCGKCHGTGEITEGPAMTKAHCHACAPMRAALAADQQSEHADPDYLKAYSEGYFDAGVDAAAADQQGEREDDWLHKECVSCRQPFRGPKDQWRCDRCGDDTAQGKGEDGMTDVSWERQLKRTRDDAWNAALDEAARLVLQMSFTHSPSEKAKAIRSLKRGTP